MSRTDPQHENGTAALAGRYHAASAPWRGGLSLEQDRALRILLRPERSLDAQNPWRDLD